MSQHTISVVLRFAVLYILVHNSMRIVLNHFSPKCTDVYCQSQVGAYDLSFSVLWTSHWLTRYLLELSRSSLFDNTNDKTD